MLEDGPAVDSRHREVEDDDVWLQLVRLVDAATPVGGRRHRPPLRPEVLGVDPPRVHVVVDDEHDELCSVSAAIWRHMWIGLPIASGLADRAATLLPADTDLDRIDRVGAWTRKHLRDPI